MLVKKKVVKLSQEELQNKMNRRFIPIQKKSTGSLSPLPGNRGGTLTQSCVFQQSSKNLFSSDNVDSYKTQSAGSQSMSNIQIPLTLTPKMPSLSLPDTPETDLFQNTSYKKISKDFKQSLLFAESEDNLEDSKMKSIPTSSKHRIFQELENKTELPKMSTQSGNKEDPPPSAETRIMIKVSKIEDEEPLAKVKNSAR